MRRPARIARRSVAPPRRLERGTRNDRVPAEKSTLKRLPISQKWTNFFPGNGRGLPTSSGLPPQAARRGSGAFSFCEGQGTPACRSARSVTASFFEWNSRSVTPFAERIVSSSAASRPVTEPEGRRAGYGLAEAFRFHPGPDFGRKSPLPRHGQGDAAAGGFPGVPQVLKTHRHEPGRIVVSADCRPPGLSGGPDGRLS